MVRAAGPSGVIPAGNPWLQRRPLNIAHQGGSLAAPANTMFAFARALEAGAHSLELDVHATADGHLVVIHDDSVDRTTNGSGRVDQLRLSELRELDAAHWFVPDEGVCRDRAAGAYPYRGIATGAVAPPKGSSRLDFTVPTLADVFAAFPGVHVNIDIKNTAPHTAAYEQTLAALIARHDRHADVIVGSFHDTALAAFKQIDADVPTAAGPAEVVGFWTAVQEDAAGAGVPGHVALQVPITFEGLTVVDEAFVVAAHQQDLAVHVWTVNDSETMAWLLGIGVDGVVTDRPGVLAEVLRAQG